MRLFNLALVAFSSFVVSSCLAFRSMMTLSDTSSSIVHDYVATGMGGPLTSVVSERIKALPRNSIIAFCVDDKAEVEQLFKHQRVFSGEGFYSFAIVDGKDALTPVFFLWFRGKTGCRRWQMPYASADNECRDPSRRVQERDWRKCDPPIARPVANRESSWIGGRDTSRNRLPGKRANADSDGCAAANKS